MPVPVCLKPLVLRGDDGLKCKECKRVYPIRNGIPILVEPEATIERKRQSKTRLTGLSRQLKAKMPNIKLIFLTMHEDPYLVGEAFRAGGSAFLLKEAAAISAAFRHALS